MRRWLRGLGLPARATELQLEPLLEWRDGLRLCEVVEALERCANLPWLAILALLWRHACYVWREPHSSDEPLPNANPTPTLTTPGASSPA